MTTRIHQLNLDFLGGDKNVFQIWPTLFVVVKTLLKVDYYRRRSHSRDRDSIPPRPFETLPQALVVVNLPGTSSSPTVVWLVSSHFPSADPE